MMMDIMKPPAAYRVVKFDCYDRQRVIKVCETRDEARGLCDELTRNPPPGSDPGMYHVEALRRWE